MTLEEYISKINQRFQLGNATEHTFRGDLQTLLESIVPKVSATNEPICFSISTTIKPR